jgi:hypothetical protein
MGTVDVDPIQEQHVKMDIQVGGTPKALNQGHCVGLCRGFGVAGFVAQMRGNGSINDAQYLAHDGGLTGRQKAQMTIAQ